MDEVVYMLYEGDMVKYKYNQIPRFCTCYQNRKETFVGITSWWSSVQICKECTSMVNVFSATLKKMGSKMHSYGPCVANKVIDWIHYTICWYVDTYQRSSGHESHCRHLI